MGRRQFKAGLIGCGRIGALLEDDPLRGKPCTHAGAILKHPQTNLVALCDIDIDRLNSVGDKYGIDRLYTDYKEMLTTENLDVVSIATWTHLHAEMALAAIDANAVGIYCEKPLAANLDGANEVVRAIEKSGVKMVVGHERRWGGKFRAIRKMLQNGELGELKTMTGYVLSSAWPKTDRYRYGGGAAFHDGTHMTDLFRYFGGEAEKVWATVERSFGDDSIENGVWAKIKFANGANGFFVGGDSRDYFHFELDIQTDRARVLIGNNGAKLFISDISKQFSGFKELQQVPFPESDKELNPFVGGFTDLIDQIENGNESISSVHDGYKAMEIIFAMYHSAENGGTKVLLPL